MQGYRGPARYGSRLDGAAVRPGETGHGAAGSQSYAPASVDVFASAAARQGAAGAGSALRGGLAGSYRRNVGGSTYTVGQGGQVLSRQFPGSALSGGVYMSRGGGSYTSGRYGGGVSGAPASLYGSTAGASASRYGSGAVRYGSTAGSPASGYGSTSGASAGSYGGTSGGSEGRYGGGRHYQVTPASVPVVSVRGGTSGAQVRYTDISIKGLAYDKGAAGGMRPARSRRDTI